MAIVVAMSAASPPSIHAQSPVVDAIGCDSLVALRLLTAQTSSSTEAADGLFAYPSCRRVARTELGDVAQRAMIGGAPFECLAIRKSDTCLWIAP